MAYKQKGWSPFTKPGFAPPGKMIKGLATMAGFHYLTDKNFRKKAKDYIKDLSPFNQLNHQGGNSSNWERARADKFEKDAGRKQKKAAKKYEKGKEKQGDRKMKKAAKKRERALEYRRKASEKDSNRRETTVYEFGKGY